MRLIDRSVNILQLEILMKIRLCNEVFSIPKSVISHPETFSILSLLHIFETSTRWLSLNLDSQTLSSRFAKAFVTWNSALTSLAMFRIRIFFQSLFVFLLSTYSQDMAVFTKSNNLTSAERTQITLEDNLQLLVGEIFAQTHRVKLFGRSLSHNNCWIVTNLMPQFANMRNSC